MHLGIKDSETSGPAGTADSTFEPIFSQLRQKLEERISIERFGNVRRRFSLRILMRKARDLTWKECKKRRQKIMSWYRLFSTDFCLQCNSGWDWPLAVAIVQGSYGCLTTPGADLEEFVVFGSARAQDYAVMRNLIAEWRTCKGENVHIICFIRALFHVNDMSLVTKLL